MLTPNRLDYTALEFYNELPTEEYKKLILDFFYKIDYDKFSEEYKAIFPVAISRIFLLIINSDLKPIEKENLLNKLKVDKIFDIFEKDFYEFVKRKSVGELMNGIDIEAYLIDFYCQEYFNKLKND